jgi:hypothetical protein
VSAGFVWHQWHKGCPLSSAVLLFRYSALSVVRPRGMAHAPSACASAALARFALVSDVGLMCVCPCLLLCLLCVCYANGEDIEG